MDTRCYKWFFLVFILQLANGTRSREWRMASHFIALSQRFIPDKGEDHQHDISPS
jgi:hypothetical protein